MAIFVICKFACSSSIKIDTGGCSGTRAEGTVFSFLSSFLFLFQVKRERDIKKDRVIPYVLAHSSNACNGQHWVTSKSGRPELHHPHR